MTERLTTRYAAAMRRRGLAPGTIYARRRELARWVEHVGEGWRTATRHDVEAWLDTRPLGARARYTAISHLSAFYRWAMREELVGHDPTMTVERPRLPQRLPRPVRADHVRQLLGSVAGDRLLEPAVLLMLDAGLRCCEVARLTWRDVDLEAGTLYVFGKGSRERMVGTPQRLRHALYLHGADDELDEPVIGRRISAARVSQLVNARCHALGLEATAHRLRHTYATRLLRATAGDLRAVQMSLGHASVATTQVYAAVDVDRVLAAARLLDDEHAA